MWKELEKLQELLSAMNALRLIQKYKVTRYFKLV